MEMKGREEDKKVAKYQETNNTRTENSADEYVMVWHREGIVQL